MTKQRLTLVTGASRGLGYALAIEATKRGDHVIALARTQGALDELADNIASTGSITIVPMDITDEGAIQYLGKSIYERWGGLDLWFHTAWFTAPLQPVTQLGQGDFDKALATNVKATARLITMITPLLQVRKSSRAVFFDDAQAGRAFYGNSGMAKAAQMSIVQSWQNETAKLGPDVHVFSPPPMATSNRATLFPGQPADELAKPSEVAQTIFAELKA